MKNDDLISRGALMQYINDNHSYAGLPMAAHICTMELLTYAPAVDAVEVVHGRWELYPSSMYRRCSVCKIEYDRPKFNVRANFCPNCGAKMDGDVNV